MEEVPSRIEPCFLPENVPDDLVRLASSICSAAEGLGHDLPISVVGDIADIVRVVNAYHSSRIEGHKASPYEVEAALTTGNGTSGFPDDVMVMVAHVNAQRKLDRSFPVENPTSEDFVSRIHEALYEGMPISSSSIDLPGKGVRQITPGAFRRDGDPEIVVGRHQPPSSHRVSAFMAHYSARYRHAGHSPQAKVMAIPAAHHRLSYIHPFPDGNGRVCRLMSHAMSLEAGIGGNGLWSMSRGMARGIRGESDYRRMMDHADHPRMGALDGRGNLSQKALVTFSQWFLSCMLEQIADARKLFNAQSITARLQGLKAQGMAATVPDGRIPITWGALMFPELFEHGEP